MNKSNSNSKRSRKPQRKPNSRSKRDKADEKELDPKSGSVKESPTNDEVFYSSNPQLIQAASNITFAEPAGAIIEHLYRGGDYKDNAVAVPGLATISLIPIPGSGTDANAPLNLAAKNLYAEVRKANSGSSTYDAPDLMIYSMSIAQVYSFINWCERLYGFTPVKDALNDYLPRALVYANGVDYDSLIKNKANFNFMINDMITTISKFAVPSGVQYFNRLAFLFSGYYSEGESIKDQLYMYIPEGFMQYSSTASEKGGSMVYKQLFGTGTISAAGFTNLLTPEQIYDYGMSLINAILSSGTFKNMTGDIRKAFVGDIIQMAPLPTEFVVLPTTDLVVLEQFQNADIIDTIPDTVSVTQDPDNDNLLTVRISIDSKTSQLTDHARRIAASLERHVLTTILTNPSPMDITERTRLQMTTNSYSDDTSSYLGFEGSSEIPCKLRILRNFRGTNVNAPIAMQYAQYTTRWSYGLTPDFTTMNLIIAQHSALEAFSFHPGLFYFYENTGSSELAHYAIDYNNYTTIDERVLFYINAAVMKNLFEA